MRKLRLLSCLCPVLALTILAAPAAADPTAGPPICPGPSAGVTPISGHYRDLTITGNRYVASGTTLKVRGNLTLARGACLDAFTLGTVKVRRNLLVGKGAILALGCTPNSTGPGAPCNGQTTSDTVGRNLIANHPYTMYLDGDTIHGSVISKGGGPGLVSNPSVNFPIKDNAIDGNLIVQDWHGGWVGAIRNTVGRNLIFSRNMSVADPDANEVQTNTVFGNLICRGNSPAAHVNPMDMGLPNTVAGGKIGQCAGL